MPYSRPSTRDPDAFLCPRGPAKAAMAAHSTIEITLSVRVPLVKPWEGLFVVGSEAAFGNWMPTRARPMQRSPTDRNLWQCSVVVPSSLANLGYRYFIGYYLDPAKGAPSSTSPLLLVHRWESSVRARVLHPNLLQRKGSKAVRDAADSFGMIDGRSTLRDGWLSHAGEGAFFLRIHGPALGFYRPRDKNKQYRLKVVPFDVRFRDAYCYEDRHTRTGLLWRASSFFAKTRAEDDRGPEPDADDVAPPEHPSYSNTELSVLTRDDPIFGEQYEAGSIFRNDVDYLVFRTRTVALEFLGLRIELYAAGTPGIPNGTSSPASGPSSDSTSVRLGVAYALPTALSDTYGKATLPIINTASQRPIGQINVDYMLARCTESAPPELRDTMAESFSRHWKKRQMLEIGHRGCGSSYTKEAVSRENTLFSLQEAGRKGADLVEFDVHLTKDKHAVIYHDFHVCVEVMGRNGSIDSRNHRMHEDLKLSQLQQLHFEHTSTLTTLTAAANSLRVTPSVEDTNLDHSPFPPLRNALESIDPQLGFNIEVKYPMMMKDGKHECAGGYFERNEFCDVIVNEVMAYAGSRRILFSSFDPDICTLLSLKQHRFPVLFLVVGATARYDPFEDIRTDCSRLAVNYAAGTQLLGVNFHSEELLKDRSPFDRARTFNLVTFVWGDDINDRKIHDFFKRELGVDAIIYDRIGEEESRKSVFLVERTAKTALFTKSAGVSPASSRPSSRRNSLDTSSDTCDVRTARGYTPPSNGGSSPVEEKRISAGRERSPRLSTRAASIQPNHSAKF